MTQPVSTRHLTDAQLGSRIRMAAKCISLAALKGEHHRVPSWQSVLSQLNFERTRRQSQGA